MPPPIIREANPDDASALVELFHRLYAETSFLLFEPGELELKPADLGERIRQTKVNASGTMCVAHAGGGLVGLAFGNRGTARRTSHGLGIVMGVLQSHWQQGVGQALLGAVEAWATRANLHRLELTVQTSNNRAIALYERAGFVREGLKRHSLRISGEFVDEWHMSKLLSDA